MAWFGMVWLGAADNRRIATSHLDSRRQTDRATQAMFIIGRFHAPAEVNLSTVVVNLCACRRHAVPYLHPPQVKAISKTPKSSRLDTEHAGESNL